MCGKNVTLEEDGTRAVRVAGYAHGLVFSTKELKAEEVFEVGCGEVEGALPARQTGPPSVGFLTGESGRDRREVGRLPPPGADHTRTRGHGAWSGQWSGAASFLA